MNGLAIHGECCSRTPLILHPFAQLNWVELPCLKDEFGKRNVKVIAVSVDDLDSHNRWTARY